MDHPGGTGHDPVAPRSDDVGDTFPSRGVGGAGRDTLAPLRSASRCTGPPLLRGDGVEGPGAFHAS